MISRLTLLLVRVLLETAVLLAAVALLLTVAAYRVGRRLLRDRPDPLERGSAAVTSAAQAILRRER